MASSMSQFRRQDQNSHPFPHRLHREVRAFGNYYLQSRILEHHPPIYLGRRAKLDPLAGYLLRLIVLHHAVPPRLPDPSSQLLSRVLGISHFTLLNLPSLLQLPLSSLATMPRLGMIRHPSSRSHCRLHHPDCLSHYRYHRDYIPGMDMILHLHHHVYQ